MASPVLFICHSFQFEKTLRPFEACIPKDELTQAQANSQKVLLVPSPYPLASSFWDLIIKIVTNIPAEKVDDIEAIVKRLDEFKTPSLYTEVSLQFIALIFISSSTFTFVEQLFNLHWRRLSGLPMPTKVPSACARCPHNFRGY